jgi:hypothetical protein
MRLGVIVAPGLLPTCAQQHFIKFQTCKVPAFFLPVCSHTGTPGWEVDLWFSSGTDAVVREVG